MGYASIAHVRLRFLVKVFENGNRILRDKDLTFI